MRLPRLIIGNAAGWIRLLQRERKENIRLRRELLEWQGKLLQLKGVTPLFQPPLHVEPIKRPPVGPTMKRAYLAGEEAAREVNNPTAEQVLGIQ